MSLSLVIQELVVGIATGSIYALIALGYTLVYGIIELINFAHGDVFHDRFVYLDHPRWTFGHHRQFSIEWSVINWRADSDMSGCDGRLCHPGGRH